MNEGQKFPIKLKTGQITEAELIERVKFNNKDFAFYAVENPNDTVDIYTSYIVKDEQGFDRLADITDDEELIWAVDYINELVKMGE